MIKFSPSLLAADFCRIGEEIALSKEAGADYLHFDVMDGMFVPNITFGQPVLKSAAKTGLLDCDVHLMVEQPERYVEEFAAAGAKILTVHAEATKHLQRTLSHIRACGCIPGVALNPATSPDCLRYVMGDFDLALVMTVNPGFGGQKMLPRCVSKIGEIRRMLDAEGLNDVDIEVDGGVTLDTAPGMIAQGATVLVAGSAFFHSKTPLEFGRALKGLA